MATAEEIERRVEQADTARSAKRSAAAQQVGALAQRRAAIAEQLTDIEEQLGDVLAAVSDVMDLDELAGFTDVPAADLTRWLTARKPTRTKRKRLVASGESDTNRGPSAARTSTARPTSTPPEAGRTEAADTPVRVPAEVA
jgi:seryl-tRNA synthetase